MPPISLGTVDGLSFVRFSHTPQTARKIVQFYCCSKICDITSNVAAMLVEYSSKATPKNIEKTWEPGEKYVGNMTQTPSWKAWVRWLNDLCGFVDDDLVDVVLVGADPKGLMALSLGFSNVFMGYFSAICLYSS